MPTRQRLAPTRPSPPAYDTPTVTRDITTVGLGAPSCGGLVGSAPMVWTTFIPDTTFPASA